jgi:hypothetical protein
MGAYENENGAGPYNGPVWYVDASSELPYGNGSESAKFSKIQYGINAASEGDTVLVAEETYFENIDFSGKNIVVMGANQETTIIDGNQAGSVVTFSNSETSSAKLVGLTIQNGSHANGGGIYCASSEPTLTNVTISGNTASVIGGGMYLHQSSPTIINLIIWGNEPGSMATQGSSVPIITYSDIEGGYTGTGNIDADPLFVNAANGNYRHRLLHQSLPEW